MPRFSSVIRVSEPTKADELFYEQAAMRFMTAILDYRVVTKNMELVGLGGKQDQLNDNTAAISVQTHGS